VTPYHVAVLIASLVVPTICGLHTGCHDSLPQIIDLCKIAIVGTLGNALNTHARAQIVHKDKEG